MNSHKPPVALFGFNRPDCIRVVFEEIRRYQPTHLFLIADGPRSTVPTDAVRCKNVREIMQSVDWKCEIQTNFAEENLGCQKRMWSGIDWVFSNTEEAIFLEDDCVPCLDFFEFCSEMLAHYRDNPRVMHIAGTNFQRGQKRGDGSYYFSIYPQVWGWASWRRAWLGYDLQLRSWPQAKKDKWLSTIFPNQLEQKYWTYILDLVYTRKIDSCWDYQWLYKIWRQNGISLNSNINLITNIGGGPDATHTQGAGDLLDIPRGTLGKLQHPNIIEVDPAADEFTFTHVYGGEKALLAARPMARLHRGVLRAKRIVTKLLNSPPP